MFVSLRRIIVLSIILAYGISGLPGSLLSSNTEAYYQVSPTLGVGDLPNAAIAYNNKVYIANRYSNTISVIDGITNVVTTIPVGGSPNDILAHNNRLYVTNNTSGTVSVINPTTNTVISTISVGSEPAGIVEVNNKLYTWEYDAGSPLFHIIDTVDYSVSTIPGLNEIQDVHVVNNNIYVTTFENNNVRAINTINNTTSDINLSEFARRLTSIGDILYIRGTNNITALDTVNETLNLIPIPVIFGGPSSNMTSLGNKIYITNQGLNSVSIVDTITNTVSNVNVGDTPTLFTTLNNKVYVSNYNSDNVSIINGSDNTVSHVTVGDGPSHLTSLNNKVYVANSLSDTVSIINNIPSITYPTNGGVLTTNIVTFTGEAEAGSLVSIMDNIGNILTNTIANSNNTFIANYIATGPGIYTVRPIATFNTLSNTGSFTSFSILGGQITSPADNSMTTNTNIIFSGTATSGATVDILLNGLSIGIATGDNNNMFSFNPGTSYPIGAYTVQPIFTLGSTTVSGTISNFSIVSTLSAPIITSFVDNTVFNTNTINFSGTVSSGANVYFLLNGVNAGSTIGTTGSTFSYTLSNLLSGNYTLQPIATINGQTQTGNILNFNIAPSIAVPAITSFVDNAVFNNPVINITGTATSGSTVNLLLNNTLLGSAIANSSNVFSYSFSSIANGSYIIQPVATLNWMIQTGTSLNFTYIGNTGITAPVITSPANNSTNNGAVTFYGNGMPGYVVAIVNQGGNTVINGSVNSNGIFSLGPISVPSGSYTVKAITGGNNIFGNSITITTSYNNNNNNNPTDYCPNGDYTSSLYDGLCGTYVNNNNNPLLPWMDDDDTEYNDDDYDIDSDVLSQVCVPYEDDGYSNDLYESLKVYKKEIFVICWMKHNGLTKHTKTGYFRGGDSLRRDESTKFIYNFLTEVLGIQAEKKNTFCNYQDLYAYNNDLKNYIKNSCEAGLYKGTQNNTKFNPSYFLKTNYFYSIVSNMIKVYQPNGDTDVSILDDISEINKNSTSKMTRLKAAHALYKLSQILYTSTN